MRWCRRDTPALAFSIKLQFRAISIQCCWSWAEPLSKPRSRSCAEDLPGAPSCSIWAMACCRGRHPRMSRCSPGCSRSRTLSPDMTRVAVVLMNLGGPDSLASVQPFLVNLFSDPAIIGLPGLLRLPLARFIAWRRGPVARDIYARLGGRSPLLANTEAQARALEAALGPGHRCFVAMRYWHPMSAETANEVANWSPDEIICLPLYPQFSTTTTDSSLAAWRSAASRHRLDRITRSICCYPC